MFKLVLEKAEEPEIKLPTSAESWKKQESFRKTSISVLLTMRTLGVDKIWPRPWGRGWIQVYFPGHPQSLVHAVELGATDTQNPYCPGDTVLSQQPWLPTSIQGALPPQRTSKQGPRNVLRWKGHCFLTQSGMNIWHPLDHWKAREFQKNIYFYFTDYAKAFDSVDDNKLWKIHKEKYQTTS